MKVSVCYFGLLRSFMENYQTHLDNLINPYNVDVFMFCPDFLFPPKNSDPFNNREENNEHKVNVNDMINIFGDNLKLCQLYHANNQMFIDKVNDGHLPLQNTLGSPSWRNFSMFYNIQEAVKLKRQFENANDFKYDVAILLRPDCKFTKMTDLNKINLEKVTQDLNHIAPVFGTEHVFNDHIIATKSDNLNVLCDLYEKVPEYIRQGWLVNNETLIFAHFMKNNIESEQNDFAAHMVMR